MQENKDNSLTKEDIDVLKFLERYKILKIEDASLIYKTKRYYRNRVNKLIGREYVKRYKEYIMLDKKGRKVLGTTGVGYIKNICNKSYMERLKHISSIATITINSSIEFLPSWEMKNKNIYTDTSRRYIGKIIIDEKEYLTYYISNKKEHVYIKQILFDINKAMFSKNIIVFLEGLNILNNKYGNLMFDKENTYIIVNNKENKELLKKYVELDIHDIMQGIYKKELLISDWEYADYLLDNNKYIINMIFINTEVISRLNWFYKENSNTKKEVEIITIKENEEKIKELLRHYCKIIKIDKNLIGGISENIEESIV